MEFKDHRPYSEGDDYRTIDWSVFGRSGQLFVKRFTDETDWEVHVVIDRSASMLVGKPSKDVFCRRVAAGFAYAFSGAGRSVQVHELRENLSTVGEAVRDEAGCARLLASLEALDDASNRSRLSRVSELYRPGPRSRHIFVISDFLGAESLGGTVLGPRSRKVEVSLVCVVAGEERSPAYSGSTKMIDLESGDTILLRVGRESLQRYTELFQVHLQDVEKTARMHDMTFAELSSESSFDRALLDLVRKGGVT